MVIKGTVHNGQIRIENTILPEGTQVVITPVQSPVAGGEPCLDLKPLKETISRIASLPCQNSSNDGFSGADHDRILYGN